MLFKSIILQVSKLKGHNRYGKHQFRNGETHEQLLLKSHKEMYKKEDSSTFSRVCEINTK